MATLTKEFLLDPTIVSEGSAVSLAVDGSTDAHTLAAIATNSPFPTGAIELGRIAVNVDTGKGLALKSGDATVRFKSSAAVQSGIGVFDAPADAVASLQLHDAKSLTLNLLARPNSRWAVMRWAYSVTGAVAGSHPIGVVGSAKFGVDAERDGTCAILHCFDRDAGARDVLGATARGWRLPRHVNIEGAEINLPPESWLVAEVDGSLALTMGARLGYDVSFVRESAALGLSGDLGAKLDATLKASFGVTASGRYLVVVGRESGEVASTTVRLRLYKQSKNGLDFALNLNVGLTASVPLPDTFDDFVETVFGVHGPRVMKDLHVFEQWIDPTKDLGENVARLTTRTALDFLRQATGLDPSARFDEARKLALDAVKRWDALPDTVAAATWRFLSKSTPVDGADPFRTFLQALAGVDVEKRRQALAGALKTTIGGDTPEAEWLLAIADRGLLAIAQDLERASEIARATLAVLDGGIVQRIHDFIVSSLDLTAVRQAVQNTDFNALNEWLVGRLGGVIDRTLPGIEDLRQIQQAVFGVDQKVREVYEQGIKALTKRYSADFAATYQRTTADTALVDVSFDLSAPLSLALFRRVVGDGDLDALLLASTDGVTIHDATLSHEMCRTTRVELRMPFISSDISHVTKSLTKLSVEEHAGRVLVYEFGASDKVTVANRARSELSVLGTLRAAGGEPRPAASGTIAYEARQVKARMRPADLELRTRPFVDAYLSTLFPGGGASRDAFYAALRAGVTGTLEAGSDCLGDVAVSMQVTYPAAVLESWLRPRDSAAVRADAMRLSRAVQFSLRRLLTRTYLENIDNLQFQGSVAALLVWSSMPISTSIHARGAAVRFNTDRDVFWDYVAIDARRAVARDPHTAAALAAALGQAEARLRVAGRAGGADFFAPGRARHFVDLALDDTGDLYLQALLNAEALVIAGATNALEKIASAVAATATAPSLAVRTLSEFASALVDTFNGRLQFLYSPESIRTLGPSILADASAAIHPTPDNVQPGAMLKIYVLDKDHTFALSEFLNGELPPAAEVAGAETLVRL